MSLVFQDALQDLKQIISGGLLDPRNAQELRSAVTVGVGILAQVVSTKSTVEGTPPFLTFLNYANLRTSCLAAQSSHTDAGENACSEVRQLVECLNSRCPHAVRWLRVRFSDKRNIKMLEENPPIHRASTSNAVCSKQQTQPKIHPPCPY
jgi:hypothetical protein